MSDDEIQTWGGVQHRVTNKGTATGWNPKTKEIYEFQVARLEPLHKEHDDHGSRQRKTGRTR